MDRHVGARIRRQRILLGLTLQQLADAVGVTYQQIYKYESGGNRVPAGRLYQFATVLAVRVDHFFQTPDQGSAPQAGHERQFLELAKSYQLLSASHQQVISRLAEALAE
jgi:transcriptional regulator with XRE-family HTH domain